MHRSIALVGPTAVFSECFSGCFLFKSFTLILLPTLCRRAKTQLYYFQPIPDSLGKTPGVGGPSPRVRTPGYGVPNYTVRKKKCQVVSTSA